MNRVQLRSNQPAGQKGVAQFHDYNTPQATKRLAYGFLCTLLGAGVGYVWGVSDAPTLVIDVYQERGRRPPGDQGWGGGWG